AEHGFHHVFHPGDGMNTDPSEEEGGKAEYLLTRETLRFIEANRDRPFLAYLGHYTPHIPYTARRDLVERNAGAFEPVYAALIETLDDTVGLLLRRLEELGLTERTIVVFTSDNGGLHVPELNHPRVTHNTPFRAGKGFNYEGGMRVPLIVRWPGRVPARRVVDAPVNNTGWIPTLLEMVGAPVPEGLDGTSFASGVLGGTFPEEPIFWHFPHYTNQGGRPTGAMRDGRWMLVEYYDEPKAELYDLETDVSQRRDLAGVNPERVAAMRAALARWREQNAAQLNTPNPDCNEALFRRLYVEVDPSRFDPLTATDDEWREMAAWRRIMDRPSAWNGSD
ncbi:MAG: sulfatase-like hydrolase/transferase, partial [Fimbriimonadales bacterium]